MCFGLLILNGHVRCKKNAVVEIELEWRWSGWSKPSRAWPELLHDAVDSG
jgi:hypothetical protein